MTQIWALYRQSGSDGLEKQRTDLRRRHHYMRDGTLAKNVRRAHEKSHVGLTLCRSGWLPVNLFSKQVPETFRAAPIRGPRAVLTVVDVQNILAIFPVPALIKELDLPGRPHAK